MKSKFIIVLLISISLYSNGQRNVVDSLENELLTVKDTVKAIVLDQLAWELKYSSPQKALEYSSWLYYYSDTINDLRYKALSLHKTGIILWVRGELSSAVDTTLSAIRFFDDLNLLKKKAACINNLAAIYKSMGDYEKALKNYQQSYQLKEALGDSAGMVSSMTNLANIRQYNGEYEQAIKQYYKAYEFAKNVEGIQPYKIGDIFNNLGVVYRLIDNYDSAVFYYNKAIALYEKEGLKIPYAKGLSNLGTTFFTIEQYDSAMYYYQKANPILTESKSQINLGRNLTNIAEVYRKRGQYNLSFKYAEEAKIALENTNALKEQAVLNHFYADLYKKIKDYRTGFTYLEKFIVLKDSLLNSDKSKEIERLNALYESEKKEKEILKLESEKGMAEKQEKIQQLHKNIAIAGIIVSIIIIFFIISRMRIRKKLFKQKEALLLEKEEEARLQLDNERLEKEHLVIQQKMKEEELKAKAEISKLTTEKLNSELEHKNRELSSSALASAQKKELLEKIEYKIKQLSKELSTKGRSDLRELKLLINENKTNDNDWENFKIHFDNVHPDFYNKLLKDNTDLSQNDLKHCTYIKVKLTSNNSPLKYAVKY